MSGVALWRPAFLLSRPALDGWGTATSRRHDGGDARASGLGAGPFFGAGGLRSLLAWLDGLPDHSLAAREHSPMDQICIGRSSPPGGGDGVAHSRRRRSRKSSCGAIDAGPHDSLSGFCHLLSCLLSHCHRADRGRGQRWSARNTVDVVDRSGRASRKRNGSRTRRFRHRRRPLLIQAVDALCRVAHSVECVGRAAKVST